MKKVLSFGNRSRVIADLKRAKETNKISFENLRLASVLVPLIDGQNCCLLYDQEGYVNTEDKFGM